jgi:hypothetical protein
MSEAIFCGGVLVLITLIVLGAYQIGFERGLATGFKRGSNSARNFARLKRSEAAPRYENPRV